MTMIPVVLVIPAAAAAAAAVVVGGSGGSSAPCDWGMRHKAFGLPGLYYNGTLTIRHHITDNTAWDEEIEDPPTQSEFTNCQERRPVRQDVQVPCAPAHRADRE